MAELDSEGERVRLADGSEVLVRAVRPDDAPLFVRGFERLSERSRYRRFFSYKRALSERELAFFTHPDHHDHEAVAALDPATGEGLGVARYVRDREDRTCAEAAVAVVDDWQGRGLGSALLERLVRRATEEGIEHFQASLLTDNRAMLQAFRHVGAVEVRSSDGETKAIDVRLPVGAAARAALRAAAAGDAVLELLRRVE